MNERVKMPTPGDLFGAPRRPDSEVAVQESSDGTNPDDTVLARLYWTILETTFRQKNYGASARLTKMAN